MGRMQRPTNYDPIVRSDHFINIEAGILKRFSNLPLVALGALDAQAGHTVMELIKQVAVQPGRAVIVVTHDNRIFDFGDRIVEMSDGRIERIQEDPQGEES